MSNQLRKLKKRQLLELLIAQGRDLEATQEDLREAEKRLENMQKQITGLEGRLVQLGAPVRKVPRTEADEKPRTERAEEPLPEDDTD